MRGDSDCLSRIALQSWLESRDPLRCSFAERAQTPLGMSTTLRDIQIFLIRHGESEGNRDEMAYTQVSDHTIPLSRRGKEQADAAASFLAGFLATLPPGLPIRVISSVYKRARETAASLFSNEKLSLSLDPAG